MSMPYFTEMFWTLLNFGLDIEKIVERELPDSVTILYKQAPCSSPADLCDEWGM